MLLVLARHGITDLTSGVLVGRTPGVHLNAEGRAQADSLAVRLKPVRLDHIWSSPMERTRETAAPLALERSLPVQVDAGLNEVDYGEWAGRPFKDLRQLDLWKRIQLRPADARFPGGEAMREAQARGVGALEHICNSSPKGAAVVFSHSDMIKMAVVHFLGLHLDMLQRIEVGPGSVTCVLFGAGAPRLVKLNDTGGLEDLRPPKRSSAVRQNRAHA